MSGSEIALIAAMEIEVKPLLASMRLVSEKFPKIYEGKIGGVSAVAVISGIGRERAANAARLAAGYKPGMLVSAGFAGGLSAMLKTGDCLVASQVLDSEGRSVPCKSFLRPGATEVKTGVLMTSDHVVGTSREKKLLRPAADAVDLETFSIAAEAARCRIPFISVRVISDAWNEDLPLDFSAAMDHGGVSPFKVMGMMMMKPHKILPVIKLGMRSKHLAVRLSEKVIAILKGSREPG